MKSSTQLMEQHVARAARAKVRACIQPGQINRLIDAEVSSFLTEVIQDKLRQELDAALGRQAYERSSAPFYRNGYKSARLKGLLSAFPVFRPVLRSKTPPSPLLGSLRNFGHGLAAALLGRFWLRGTSTRAAAQELNAVFGSKLSATDVARATEIFAPEINAWLSRPIPPEITFLFLDALYLPIRKPGFTTKQALLAAVGLTQDGRRHVLGFLQGDRENNDSWSALIKDLLNRGLKRESLALVISDDHKAIRSSVEELLAVPHQLCVVHKLRNALVRVAAPNRKDFLADFKAIYWAQSKDQALQAVGRLQARWERAYPKATQIATTEVHRFLLFMDQPQSLWTALRTSNIIERFNREIRRRLRSAGALPTEFCLSKLLWSISTEQEKRWAKRRVQKSSRWVMAA